MRFSLAPALALFTVLAAASPVSELQIRTDNGSCNNDNNSCNCGDTHCCNNSPVLGNSASGFIPISLNVLATVTCTPLTVLGVVLGTSCSKTTVCCQNVNQSGLVNIGCIGITV